MSKKVGDVLYNIVRLLLFYFFFNAFLFISWANLAGFSGNYADVFLIVCFFSLLGTYIPKFERISSIILFVSFGLYFLLR